MLPPFSTPIYVSRPNLPPLDAVVAGLAEIWANRQLTNRGPMLLKFEARLAQLFDLPHISVMTNGALALELGCQALGLRGEVITTPFTFAASVNSLVRSGLTPVFADIEPDHLTLDPARVEAAITPRTCAIMGVHVFGHPCRVAELQAVATRHGVSLIYDAAHAFGVTIDGVPVGHFGDLSMFSFHATKPFHALEGGGLAYRRPELRAALERLANHGLQPDGDVPEAGTNAKMTEVQALIGLLMLDRMPGIRARGKAIASAYRARLAELPGIDCLSVPAAGVVVNHAFAPVLIDPARAGIDRDGLHAALGRMNVMTRKYFYPAASEMAAFRDVRAADPLTVSRDAAARVLALPIYADLDLDDVHRICDMIAQIHAQTNA